MTVPVCQAGSAARRVCQASSGNRVETGRLRQSVVFVDMVIISLSLWWCDFRCGFRLSRREHESCSEIHLRHCRIAKAGLAPGMVDVVDLGRKRLGGLPGPGNH